MYNHTMALNVLPKCFTILKQKITLDVSTPWFTMYKKPTSANALFIFSQISSLEREKSMMGTLFILLLAFN
ncbi:hypothetical protein Bhyg_10824, partial [Pseudolycoriella hygida]